MKKILDEYTDRVDLTTRQRWALRHPKATVEKTQRYNLRFPEKLLWRSASDRAKKQGKVFDLPLEEINIPDICPVFKIPFERKTRFSASLDKIDPSKGYVKGNVQVISKLANLMKSDASEEELKTFAKWILNIE